ncbi:MAG: hypothetical protein J3K34DRAFT_444096 [Monoraphidium minutum]|nr:MAG: hypothetical protein J3K34DRAFT_444096 [Monoraphidium minutum]
MAQPPDHIWIGRHICRPRGRMLNVPHARRQTTCDRLGHAPRRHSGARRAPERGLPRGGWGRGGCQCAASRSLPALGSPPRRATPRRAAPRSTRQQARSQSKRGPAAALGRASRLGARQVRSKSGARHVRHGGRRSGALRGPPPSGARQRLQLRRQGSGAVAGARRRPSAGASGARRPPSASGARRVP